MEIKQSTKNFLNSQKGKTTRENIIALKKRNLLGGSIIAVVVMVSPYLFLAYEIFPQGDIWESPFGIFTSNYYGDMQVLVYELLAKVVPLILLLIWFFTCKHWWYHALIIPICTLTFQSYQIVNSEISYVVASELYIIIPLICIMAIFSYTVRTKIFDKIHGVDYNELSRVNWKGQLVTQDESEHKDFQETEAIPEEEDDEPIFMSM